MESLSIATLVVALAEIGDKTQLLAFVLTARFRQPLAIGLGILVATLANHAAAAALGAWVGSLLEPEGLRWVLGGGFIAMALWTLKPDEIDEGDAVAGRWGAFVATVIAFFLAEIGDKTQIATVALAADLQPLIAVIAGTTLGMMLVNLPVVVFADRLATRLPTRWFRRAAALLFLVLGIATIAGDGLSLTAV